MVRKELCFGASAVVSPEVPLTVSDVTNGNPLLENCSSTVIDFLSEAPQSHFQIPVVADRGMISI